MATNEQPEAAIPRHPSQPLVKDANGVVRFKGNAIVQHLLDHGGIDLNKLAMLAFTQEDRTQFAQLIGYSLNGFHELSYVSDKAAVEASAMARLDGLLTEGGGCRDGGCEIHSGVRDEPDSII